MKKTYGIKIESDAVEFDQIKKFLLETFKGYEVFNCDYNKDKIQGISVDALSIKIYLNWFWESQVDKDYIKLKTLEDVKLHILSERLKNPNLYQLKTTT